MEAAGSGEGKGGARRLLVAGATGYIGRRVVGELLARGHQVVCLARSRSGVGGGDDEARAREALAGATVRFGDVTDGDWVRAALGGERFEAVISCLGSRGGAVADAWLVEERANAHLLEAARAAGARHFILLSAICVQKPRLAFQHAKLAFEKRLVESGMRYSIVRPTAFFKSLAGQVEAVRQGRPFVVFGDGRLTACRPISERDLARYLADCLDDPERWDRVLPIGGPGPAITPLEQGAMLAELCGRPPRYRHVPVAMMDAIIAVLSLLGKVVPSLRDKAELARIGRYYATESMLVLNPATGRYDADATPEHGRDTLRQHHARLLAGTATDDRGDHAVF